MVATRLQEVTAKGIGWATSGSETPPAGGSPKIQPVSNNNQESPPSFGNESISDFYDMANSSFHYAAEQTYSTLAGLLSSLYTDTSSPELQTSMIESLPEEHKKDEVLHKRVSGAYSDQLMSMFQNPYIGVRGGQNPSSMLAVRNLLSLVPPPPPKNEYPDSTSNVSPNEQSSHTDPSDLNWIDRDSIRSKLPTTISSSETASQLAEGTLRALRDIALDEAVELHEALQYWSDRWERPILSWLEAGPPVWFSQGGYRHQVVGHKVAQIQVVLVRRCKVIGDLQQHLLRSGWQSGVAQWGVLGDGGAWAPVAGFDGALDEAPNTLPLRRVSSELSDTHLSRKKDLIGIGEIQNQAPTSSVSGLSRKSRKSLYYTNVMVYNNQDGTILTDNPALAAWSVHAMSLIRRHLFRAANGLIRLPFTSNWPDGHDFSNRPNYSYQSMDFSDKDIVDLRSEILPKWASFDTTTPTPQGITISDLPLMVAEVSALLNVMEDIMKMQKARRLGKLRSPMWLRRNWYVTAIGIPTLTYFLYKAQAKGYGWEFCKDVLQNIASFFHEHVVDPVSAIYNELFIKGTKKISDRKARNVTVATLKKMIKSWLDEYYPNMPEPERKKRAEAMDISLIETKKEESMKTIYEFNNVIRMSFIEAQFIKKEMMNAILALDEMQASNNINMNLAAVTPAVLLLYTTRSVVRFLYYVLLKIGKSREETYASFRGILTDMERLLIMRNNPPSLWKPTLTSDEQQDVSSLVKDQGSNPNILEPDDLGMLMLHIHELRTILWGNQRRFSPVTVRRVAEDLAEIAGERGVVSIQQQLQIIARMCRQKWLALE